MAQPFPLTPPLPAPGEIPVPGTAPPHTPVPQPSVPSIPGAGGPVISSAGSDGLNLAKPLAGTEATAAWRPAAKPAPVPQLQHPPFDFGMGSTPKPLAYVPPNPAANEAARQRYLAGTAGPDEWGAGPSFAELSRNVGPLNPTGGAPQAANDEAPSIDRAVDHVGNAWNEMTGKNLGRYKDISEVPLGHPGPLFLAGQTPLTKMVGAGDPRLNLGPVSLGTSPFDLMTAAGGLGLARAGVRGLGGALGRSPGIGSGAGVPGAIPKGGPVPPVPGAAAPGAAALPGAAPAAAPAAAKGLGATVGEYAFPLNPGLPRTVAESILGPAPVTFGARALQHLAHGRLALAAGAAFRGAVGSTPAMAAATAVPPLVHKESPGTAAYEQRMQDPTARALDLRQGLGAITEGDVGSGASALAQKAILPFALPYGSVRNLFDSGNRPSITSYGREHAQNLGDLAAYGSNNRNYLASLGTRSVGDALHRFGAGTGSPSNPYDQLSAAQTEYGRLHDELYAAPGGIQNPEALAKFQQGVKALEGRVGGLDVSLNRPAARERVLLDQARSRLMAEYAGNPEAQKRIEATYGAERNPEWMSAPAWKSPAPGQVPTLPFVSGRDMRDAYADLGLPPNGAVASETSLSDRARAQVDNAIKSYTDRLRPPPTVLAPPSTVATPVTPPAAPPGAPAGAPAGAPPVVPGAATPPAPPAPGSPAAPAGPPAGSAAPAEAAQNISQAVQEQGVSGALAAAEAATAPYGFRQYWDGLDGPSKLLAVGGLSLAAIMTLRSMFRSEEDSDESFLTKILPILGLGAAAWGVGGGTFSTLPQMQQYRNFGRAVGTNISDLKERILPSLGNSKPAG